MEKVFSGVDVVPARRLHPGRRYSGVEKYQQVGPNQGEGIHWSRSGTGTAATPREKIYSGVAVVPAWLLHPVRRYIVE